MSSAEAARPARRVRGTPRIAGPALTAVILLSWPVAPLAQSVPVPTPRPDNTDTEPQDTAPAGEPPRVYQSACPALRSGLVAGRADASIDGSGCLARSPLLVTALGVDGKYHLSREARLNCRMATSLAEFAGIADTLATQILGSGLAEIDAGPGYECRRRNRRTGGKLSEHAFANALDISGFRLEDGRSVTVAADWQHPARQVAGEADESEPPPAAADAQSVTGRFLTMVHASACKMFTTVLGPDSNSAHNSHFHVDLGCHGRNCDYYICE